MSKTEIKDKKSLWFRVSEFSMRPTPVTVVASTKWTITIEIAGGNRVRRNKVSSGENFYPTVNEAWDAIMRVAKNKVTGARISLNNAMANQRDVQRRKTQFDAEMKGKS